jgi:hypothetical protein
MTALRHFQQIGLVLLGMLTCSAGLAKEPLPHPISDDTLISRQLGIQQPNATPSEIAGQTPIGQPYKNLLAWMQEDLGNYLENFDALFDAKLARIRKHEQQRRTDREAHTALIRAQIAQSGIDATLDAELARLNELHKPHGFVEQYSDSDEFVARFVGPKGKLLKAPPTKSEIRKMNRGGAKLLYVDTWGVPFFNTGTQTRHEAKQGVARALEVFRGLDLKKEISLLRFTELVALFARPEFDDVRRYKLLPFPTAHDLSRFGLERSDAKSLGDKYPIEAMVVINKPVDLGPVSFIFGQRLHIFGLISHSGNETQADGRIFTGPADFLEHDFAHAFFNLSPVIPGSAQEWEAVHWQFIAMRDQASSPQLKRMMQLVYYHFTHESGFRVLSDAPDLAHAHRAFNAEIAVIRELIGTRFHYDFVLSDGLYAEDYDPYLQQAFATVGTFFRDKFLTLLEADRKSCPSKVAQRGPQIRKTDE